MTTESNEIGWEFDAYEYLQGPLRRTPERPPGRPTCIEEGVFTMQQLRTLYAQTHSIRKVSAKLGVSPTTVKKYLKGQTARPGRPIQPRAWDVHSRSLVHEWFVANKNRQLPRTTREIAELSGFSVQQINRYLGVRKKAMESYLASLPPINSCVFILRDTEGMRVPTNLIKAYSLWVDRITGDVTISAVLKVGGHRIIRLPFRELEAALKGTSQSLVPIGLVRPTEIPHSKFTPYHSPQE